PLAGEDVREGLAAVLSVRGREPQFEGQTKTKLGNSEVESAVKTLVNEWLAACIHEDTQEANTGIEKAVWGGRGRAKRRARRVTSRGASRRSTSATCRANWPTAHGRIRRSASSISSRATRP